MVLVHFQEGKKKTGAVATKQQEHSSHIWHESGNILEVIELQTGKPKILSKCTMVILMRLQGVKK
jgi:hypothetical protein